MLERPRLSPSVPPPASARGGGQLALDVAAVYCAAFAVGFGYGFLVLQAGGWVGAEWERDMLRWFNANALPLWLDRVMLAVPLLGTNLTMLPAILVAGLWFWKRRRPMIGIHLLSLTCGSLFLNVSLKHLMNRDRPDLFPLRGLFDWPSYPSGHASLSVAIYFTIALMLRRERGWRWPFPVALLLVVITSYSRLYLSVHWPTDIIGGLFIGLVLLVGCWRVFAPHHRAATIP